MNALATFAAIILTTSLAVSLTLILAGLARAAATERTTLDLEQRVEELRDELDRERLRRLAPPPRYTHLPPTRPHHN